MSTLEKELFERVKVKNASSYKQDFYKGSRACRGISTTDPNKKNPLQFDLDLIKSDLLNHFHIRQGEKLSNPKFGCIVWDLLFEPFTEKLKGAIMKNVGQIINGDPRTQLERIKVVEYETGILIECTIVYLPYNVSENLRLSFDETIGLKA